MENEQKEIKNLEMATHGRHLPSKLNAQWEHSLAH